MQSIFIQVRFSENTEFGVYNDSIVFSEAEWASITQDQVDAQKKRRVQQFLYNMRNRPEPIPPTEPELVEQKTVLETQRDNIIQEIANVDARIVEVQGSGNDREPPAKVRNVRLVRRADGVLVIGWDATTDNVGVEVYNIYRDGRVINRTKDLTYYDYLVENRVTYRYQISAMDLNRNESVLSDPIDLEAMRSATSVVRG